MGVSKNKKEREVIGSGLSESVLKQIAKRGEVIGKTEKDNNHLLFFHSNGAWIRAISSVNTLTEDQSIDLATGKEDINKITGDSTLAKNNVLIGGTRQFQKEITGGLGKKEFSAINTDSQGFVTPGDFERNSYNNSKSSGYRPPPGITGLTVASKGTLGALREANLSVSVRTLEDLEMMQSLYLRPGFSILLEWGHTLQLDENGEVQKSISTFGNFLTAKQPADVIEEELQKLREDSNNNYDAMYGYVSNFSWDYKGNDGYECTIKVISKGAVLESIGIVFDPTDVIPTDQFSAPDSDEKIKDDERKSVYHKLFAELDKIKQTYRVDVDYQDFTTKVISGLVKYVIN